MMAADGRRRAQALITAMAAGDHMAANSMMHEVDVPTVEALAFIAIAVVDGLSQHWGLTRMQAIQGIFAGIEGAVDE